MNSIKNSQVIEKINHTRAPYDIVPSDEIINKTKAALEQNGITVIVTKNGEDAKQKALELIPQGSEVMTMTSVTNDTISTAKTINESGNYNPVRAKLMGPEAESVSPREKKRLGSAPEYTIGSVHAVTQNGEVMIASNSGSQLPAYAYGADHVIWLVGAQKIVETLDQGFKRIYDYVLPLEADRARKAYGVAGSNVSKLLIVNKEIVPGRITMIIVKEALGF
jgi:hypothetical protein